MTACERIRQARQLRELNEILAECGEPETTLEELERNGVDITIEEIVEPREVVVIGWDGHSEPMRRYRDQLHLPDYMREAVRP